MSDDTVYFKAVTIPMIASKVKFTDSNLRDNELDTVVYTLICKNLSSGDFKISI